MVSQLEGFESAPKKLYFHVFWVFFTTKSGILENFIQKVNFIESRPPATRRRGGHETRTEELFALALSKNIMM